MNKLLKIFQRNLFLTFASIIGFSCGISLFIYISTFVYWESKADQHHNESKYIYRVSMDHIFTKKPGLPTLGDFDTKIKENIPEIIDATHIVYSGKVKIKIYQDWVIQNRVAFIDSSFFKIFNFKIEKFDDFKNINTPNVALVSRSFYLNTFKRDNNIGQPVIEYDNHLIQIVGVFETNGVSHLNIDLLISKATLTDSNPFSNIGLTYIKSINGVSEKSLLLKLNQYSKSIIPHVPDKLGIYLEKLENVFFPYR